MAPFAVKRMLLVCTVCTITPLLNGLTNYAKNDPLPMFSTLDPQHYLDTKHRDAMKGWEATHTSENGSLSFSPFSQTAQVGKNKNDEEVPLGDLSGKWYMLGLLFGELPQDQSLPPKLATARGALFPAIPPNTPIDIQIIDPNKKFGYFSIPIKYRKRGLRMEFEGQLLCDLGIQIQGGVADTCQTVTAFNDLTGEASEPALADYPELIKKNVQNYLMLERKNIAQEINLDIGSFHKFSFEDLRINLYWRHAYRVNQHRETWPEFLLIPFFNVGLSAAISKERDYDFAFGLPFGNNDHHALGIESGVNIDFVETVEIGMLAGLTHFFGKDVTNFPVPNHECQSGIFPFRTNVEIDPGFNWYFGLKMHARHFIDRLSFYIQYLYLCHQDDSIRLKKPDPAFFPEVLEERSAWKVQVLNMAFNYDISPGINLGFLWQAPLSQCNSYKSTTVMISLNTFF